MVLGKVLDQTRESSGLTRSLKLAFPSRNSDCASSQGSMVLAFRDTKSLTVASSGRCVSVEHVSGSTARLEVAQPLVQSRHLLIGGSKVTEHFVVL